MPDLFIFILGSNISSVCMCELCVRFCQKILIIKLIDFLDISGKLDKHVCNRTA